MLGKERSGRLKARKRLGCGRGKDRLGEVRGEVEESLKVRMRRGKVRDER